MKVSFPRFGLPVFDAVIDGHLVRMLLDSGAGISVLTPSTVQAAGLRRYSRPPIRLSGSGGTVIVPMVTVNRFSIGGAHGSVMHFAAAPMFDEKLADAEAGRINGIFGADLLRGYDIDLDFPDHHAMLFKLSGCGTAAPWPDTPPVRFKTLAGGQIVLPVSIAGRPMQALLDTGSTMNIMPKQMFEAAGLSAEASHVGSGTGHGIGGRSYSTETYRLPAATIGGITEPDPVFLVGGTNPAGNYVVIGEPFIRRHEIYVSYRTDTLYIRPAR